ncbi:hypothetical protein YC2023_001502 [Brassica napus]
MLQRTTCTMVVIHKTSVHVDNIKTLYTLNVGTIKVQNGTVEVWTNTKTFPVTLGKKTFRVKWSKVTFLRRLEAFQYQEAVSPVHLMQLEDHCKQTLPFAV